MGTFTSPLLLTFLHALLSALMPTTAPGGCPCSRQREDQDAGLGLLQVSAGPSPTRDFTFLQFQKDTKDAQELLKKVDTDLDQKFSPEFKDRYQLESLLRELDVSTGAGRAKGEAAAGASGLVTPMEGHPCRSRHLAQLSVSSRTMLLPPFAWPSLTLPSPLARGCLSHSNVIAHWAGLCLFCHGVGTH